MKTYNLKMSDRQAWLLLLILTEALDQTAEDPDADIQSTRAEIALLLHDIASQSQDQQ